MSTSLPKPKISSWAVPSQADDETWERMTRAEQLEAMQELAHHPDSTTPSDVTVSEILERSRTKRKAKQLRYAEKL